MEMSQKGLKLKLLFNVTGLFQFKLPIEDYNKTILREFRDGGPR
jgi:hypothetical protein